MEGDVGVEAEAHLLDRRNGQLQQQREGRVIGAKRGRELLDQVREHVRRFAERRRWMPPVLRQDTVAGRQQKGRTRRYGLPKRVPDVCAPSCGRRR